MSETTPGPMVDARCGAPECSSKTGIYRMVGWCSNCLTGGILMLFSEGHQKDRKQCPVCGVHWSVQPQRRATDEEIPA